MENSLQSTLKTLIDSGTTSNPALNQLINDYSKYHKVFIVVGGLFTIVLLLLSIHFWKRFKLAGKKWNFEKKTYFVFGVLSVLICMFLGLIVLGNISNVKNPRNGFSGSISMLGSPQIDTSAYKFQQGVKTWVESGNAQTSELLSNKVNERLAWQRPKAIICSILLIVFTLITAYAWRHLVRASRADDAKWNIKRIVVFTAGITAVVVCLLLMLMVIGNAQGSIAPISLTLFFS